MRRSTGAAGGGGVYRRPSGRFESMGPIPAVSVLADFSIPRTASQGSLKYDVDYYTVGTQSCNGRIPVNGASKLYLGFENVRMRYTNYLWVEAVAVIPTTEYYRTQYTVE